MPQLISAALCFAVADVGSTMRWYESRLGFRGRAVPETEPFVFAILSLGPVEIMLQLIENYLKPDLYTARSGGVWNGYIRMDGITEFYQAVKDQVEIVQPLHHQPYGQVEFEVRDPNGYVLVFSEPARQ